MLSNLADLSEGFTLVPDSGIQFVEFGFNFDTSPRLSRTFIERLVPGQVDAEGKEIWTLLPNWNDDDPDADPPHQEQANDRVRTVSKALALETFLNRWVPVPFFKIEPGRNELGNEIYAHGPTDWARVRVVETRNAYGDRHGTHRAIFAFDTSLAPRVKNRPYLAPSEEDAMRAVSFRFVNRLDEIVSFLSHKIEIPGRGETDTQEWVRLWLKDILKEITKARLKRELRPDDFPYALDELSRYITFIQLLASVIKPVKATLIDTLSDKQSMQPIDVDLVLDIGNSRTCGLLIETYPDDVGVDLNNSLIMALRDLSKPELIYRDPFESRCELVSAEFGAEDIARKSGRPQAFFWPSLLRIGPEASRLRGESEGTEVVTGLSSPKRYLWSSEPVLQEWNFRTAEDDKSGVAPLVERMVYGYVNDHGDVIRQLEQDKRQFKLKIRESDMQTASAFRFSRSSFFTFMLVEIIAQAVMMMNNPGIRSERRLKDSPRRLRKIILTIPSATPVQEQRILRSRAEAAVKLLWSLSGWSETRAGINKVEPVVHCSWDEASSVHLIYLYGETSHKLGGSIVHLFETLGKERPRPAGWEPDRSGKTSETCLRIASVDVGGGTTDLMVTTYYQTDNRALTPEQNFREGFRVAGDDLLKAVIERVVIPTIEAALVAAGYPNARNFLRDRFAGDSPNMVEQEKHLRRQFVLQVLQPIAIGILSDCENLPAGAQRMSTRPLSSFFPEDGPGRGEDIPVDARVLAYLKDRLVTLGLDGFRFADIQIPVDPDVIDECVLSTFDSVFDNICEAIHHLDVDVVLLTGRPSRLPQVIGLFQNKLAIPLDRIVPIREYRVGTWYPFRGMSNTHIEDPKTTAVVGAMLCALSERQITNFTLYSDRLRMRSTARYIGILQNNNQLVDNEILFSNVDLDSTGGGEQEAKFDYHAPVRIGFRQLPLERWVATPLYKLTATQSRSMSSVRRPVKVTLARNAETADEDANDAAILSSEATREEFKIIEAEDASGTPVERLMELKLDTLAVETGDGYWLDTGILAIQ